ncbi:MAG: acyl-CoA desaturase [Maricaulaceae bacterium]
MRTPRSQAIKKSMENFSWGSAFAAIIYPALGVIVLVTMIVLGLVLKSVELKTYYIGLALGVIALSILICNGGIGPLHRIMQHRAGRLSTPAQIITMINLMIAMQGTVREWVNYHSQHHRFADEPGDPHNPFESKTWAWVGWILFRDERDGRRPMALWLKDSPVIVWMDRYYHELSILIHFIIPAFIYMSVWLMGGSLILTGILHGSFVIGRSMQFHATNYGINVLGHLKTPKWADYAMALLTGGEAFHDHHHDEPQSALHLPRKGFWNRLFDYNGTLLLVYEKLGWLKDAKISPRFT